jgi:acetyl esterase/lipase
MDKTVRMLPPRRYAYGSEPGQYGDLYRPTGAGPHPVVILIHGGFWRVPYSLKLMRKLARNLVMHDYAVWNIEYRRIGQNGGGWPGTLLDTASAADALRRLAPEYSLDLSRVCAVGHSAGGHLALWLAARSRLPPTSSLATSTEPLPLRGVISQAGASDLKQVWQLGLSSGVAAAFLGGSPGEFPERYGHASPAALLPLGVHQVLIHGLRDDIVPPSMSQHYTRQATLAGEIVTLIELPEADHFTLIDPQSAAWVRTREEIEALLKAKSPEDEG